MEEPQRKKASRRGHRAQLTKLLGKTTELMDGTIDAMQKATLRVHIQQLELKGLKLSLLDTEIAALTNDPDMTLEKKILESEEIQDTIAEIVCRAKTFLELSQQSIGRRTVARRRRQSSRCEHSYTKRPNQPPDRKAPLEITAESQQIPSPTTPSDKHLAEPRPKRAQRVAATRALQRIAEWTSS